MSLYQETIEKILNEVDADIREQMLKIEPRTTVYLNNDMTGKRQETTYNYRAYELLQDPANTILGWQALRDRKNAK